MKFNLDVLVRPNIKNLIPYSSARKEFAGAGEIFLDANENSFGSPLPENFNRYPDPLQTEIKKRAADWLKLNPNQIFIGNGSDEAIDLLFRIFCRPGQDEIIITPPTYGMYEVSANINDVAVKKILLTEDFALEPGKVLAAVTEKTKLIFLCSPNNPTGNSLNRNEVLKIAENFSGILVIDEAYVHFSAQESLVAELKNFPNLVVLQTFSKAWGLAGLRVGLALASAEIIAYFNKTKPPYNVSEVAQKTLLAALKNKALVDKTIAETIEQRELLAKNLAGLSFVAKIYPSDANFLLVKTSDAHRVYQFLTERGIIVRNRSNIELCAGCLRITIGTPEENRTLLETFNLYR